MLFFLDKKDLKNNGYNGRVNLMDKFEEKLNLQDRIPIDVKPTSYREALNGGWECNMLSKVFFSKENITIIQNSIRKSVHHCTKKIIDLQPVDKIKTIMRSIYLQNAKNLNTNITEQVKTLNKMVIDDCSSKIVIELNSYFKYRRDISNLAIPIDRPTSTYRNQVLEFRGHFQKDPKVIVERQNISKFFNNNVEIQNSFLQKKN